MLLTVLAIACTQPPEETPTEPTCEPEAVSADCLLWRCYTPVDGGIDLWYQASDGTRYGCTDYSCIQGYAEAALAECGVVDDPTADCYPIPEDCGGETCSVCYEPGDFSGAIRFECSDGWDRGVASFADQHAAIGDLLCHCDPASCEPDSGDSGL